MIILRSFRNLVCISSSTPLRYSQYRELRGITKSVQVVKPLKAEDNKSSKVDETIPSLQLQKYTKNDNELSDNTDIDNSPLAPIDPNKPPDYSISNFVPTFNFAAYINRSESLQQLVKLGVDLSKIEKRKGLVEFVLKLDFENNIKPYLLFLNDHGVEASDLGEFITKNPLIFKEDLDHLQTRINYLEVKKFKNEEIKRIITRNPFWLMFSTRRIDRRLGYFQQNFHLTGNDVRFLTTKQPRLITYKMEHIQKSTFSLKEEMGFNEEELKCLLLSKPKLWMLKTDELVERFHYVHNVMKMPHQTIIQFPEVLISREFRIRQRHEFLKKLGKAQYDPGKDLYISPKSLVEGTDLEFVMNTAKSNIKIYNDFLRTL